MTIGPEPMTRIRWMSARRGMNQVIDDVVARQGWGPAGCAAKLGVAANEDGNVHWPRERRIRSNVSGGTCPAQDSAGELADTDPFPAGHVVGVPRGTVLEQCEVGGNDVTNMQEVPHGIAIADRERPAAL